MRNSIIIWGIRINEYETYPLREQLKKNKMITFKHYEVPQKNLNLVPFSFFLSPLCLGFLVDTIYLLLDNTIQFYFKRNKKL